MELIAPLSIAEGNSAPHFRVGLFLCLTAAPKHQVRAALAATSTKLLNQPKANGRAVGVRALALPKQQQSLQSKSVMDLLNAKVSCC